MEQAVPRDGSSHKDEEDEEDEETLQLRVDALEAKLKLRALQARRAKQAATVLHREDEQQSQSVSIPRDTPLISSHREEQQTTIGPTCSKYSIALQVPLSPEKRNIIPNEPSRSPGRVLLGIDKGLRGKNVSLRRAPILKSQSLTDDDPFGNNNMPSMSASTQSSHFPALHQETAQSLQKSFSQRIAETRQQDKALKDHKRSLERLRKQRTSGFGIQQVEIEALMAAADVSFSKNASTQSTIQAVKGFSRDEIMKAYSKAPGGSSRRHRATDSLQTSQSPGIARTRVAKAPAAYGSRSITCGKGNAEHRAPPVSSDSASQSDNAVSRNDSELFESFSLTDLSRRILPHSFLVRTFKDSSIVLIPNLLRDIKAPDFSLPSALEESDFIVMGVIASKSTPLCHKDAQVTRADSSTSSLAQAADSDANVRGKYMVFTLTDLNWTVDLYLFTTAYTRFWKLTPGTVVAILNPTIMPPPRGKEDTGRWSLALNSSEDTILEIGTAKDLGFCKATKKDGKTCESWVDLKKTEFCEWHVDRGVEKCRRGRMEVQGMSVPFAPGGKKGGRSGFFGRTQSRRGKEDESHGLLKEGRQYDRESRSAYFIGSSFGGGGAATLFDADRNGFGTGLTKEEALRKRLAEREKEKNIAKKLGEAGNGTGAEYLRTRHSNGQIDDASEQAGKANMVDAGALGLLDNSARNVQLSPIKRKQRSESTPFSRKKTRFVTSKGIRVAGEESLGLITAVGTIDGGLSLPDEDCLDVV